MPGTSIIPILPPPASGSRKVIEREISRLRTWDVGSSARVDHFIGQFRPGAQAHRKILPPRRRRSSTRRWIPIFSSRPPGRAAIISCWSRPWCRTRTPAWSWRPSADRATGWWSSAAGMEQKACAGSPARTPQWLPAVSGERLRELYQNARALVFAGVEDFGIAFAESQACATPVIAFDRGGARDIVVDRVTGVLFPEATVRRAESGARRFRAPGPGRRRDPRQQPAFLRGPLPRGIRALRRTPSER